MHLYSQGDLAARSAVCNDGNWNRVAWWDQSVGCRMIAAIGKVVVKTLKDSQRHIVLVLAAAERNCIVFKEYQHRHWDPVV